MNTRTPESPGSKPERSPTAAALAASRRLDSAIVLFYFAWRGLTEARDRTLGARGLGQVHHRALFALARLPPLSVTQLCGALGISRQALHRPLAELVEAGLVSSMPAAHSKRERAIALTAAGAALERRATGSQRRRLAAALKAAGPEATRGWHAVMQALGAAQAEGLPEVAQQWLVPEAGPRRGKAS